MRNISNKFVVNQNKYFMFKGILFFSKILPFMRYCAKIWYRQTGHRWQYNITHALLILCN